MASVVVPRDCTRLLVCAEADCKRGLLGPGRVFAHCETL